MRKLAVFVLGLLLVMQPAWAKTYTASELDQLLAPIALFPDPLLAEVLPAAAYPADIAAAEAYVKANPSGSGVDDQGWEKSVIAVAHYPDVLAQMAGNMQWTTSVGQAFQTQMTDVSNSIQRLRAKAQAAGTLTTTSQQNVTTDGNTIIIEPASPQYIYVPTYDATSAYYPGGLISFGMGMAVGSWMTSSWDWYGHSVYTRPWAGPYWTNRESLSYVHNTYNRAGVNNWGYNNNYVNRVGNTNYNRVGNTNYNRVGNTNVRAGNTVNVNNVNVDTANRYNNTINSQNYRGYSTSNPTFDRNATVNAAAAQVNSPRMSMPTFNAGATAPRGAFDGMGQGDMSGRFSERGSSSWSSSGSFNRGGGGYSGGGGGFSRGGGGGGFRGGRR